MGKSAANPVYGTVDEAGQGIVPRKIKIAWSVGSMSETLMANSITFLALPIYNIALGVSPVLVGWATALPRLWDAITDPLMGNISDNTRSRWGRRRPYIALGAILAGIFFAIMWMPSTKFGEWGLFFFFLGVSILYYTAYTIFVVPHNALGFELSTDYNERTRVMSYRMFFASLAGVLFLAWAYKLCMLPIFKNEIIGVRYVGCLFGLLMIGFGIIPAVFCRENIQIQTQNKINLIQAFKFTLTNYPFLLLTGIAFTLLVGLFMVANFGTYINIYYVYGGDKKTAATMVGIGYATYQATGLLSVFLVGWLGVRLGKKPLMVIGQILVIFASLATWYLYTPKFPYLQLISLILINPGLVSVIVLSNSMVADICDVDEVNSGLRREGMYSAVFSWVFKGGIAGATVLNGYLLKWSGYDQKLGALQTPETIFLIRLLFAVVPALCVVLSLVLAILYPITQKRMHEVRAILDERKK